MKEFRKELGQWRKDPAGPGGKKKPKYSYRTVDELKAKGKLAGRSTAASAGELAQVKVWYQSILNTLLILSHKGDYQATIT